MPGTKVNKLFTLITLGHWVKMYKISVQKCNARCLVWTDTMQKCHDGVTS